jgi:hypothetical protein
METVMPILAAVFAHSKRFALFVLHNGKVETLNINSLQYLCRISMVEPI